MGHRRERHEEILLRVLELSQLQRKLLSENRFNDLLKSQSEREALLAELEGSGKVDIREERLKRLVETILVNDRVLTLSIESSMGEIRCKLDKIKNGLKALRAYSSPQCR